MSSEALRNESWGVVEPRKAAEVISTTYLFCVLKGLNRAPQVIANPSGHYDPSVLSAEDISCLVVPDGCVGLPTLAACEQGIPVVAVRNNTNLMRNDLRNLPFRTGQLQYAANYYEAAGILSAMKAGVAPATLARPMQPLRIDRVGAPAEPVVEEAVVAAIGNGHTSNGNGHSTNGNGHAVNGNGKARKAKAAVAAKNGEAEAQLLAGVNGE
jgi:hypothetical protein